MLDHRVHALGSPAVPASFRGLETVHIGTRQVDVQVRIFAEGAVETVPARFSGQVDLRAERRGDAPGPVFFRGDVAELSYALRVEGRCESLWRGPERNLSAGAGVEFGRRTRFVAGV